MISSILALVFGLALTSPGPSYTVHEWGTFTMVIDADGKQLGWYRPLLTESLPAFVHHGSFGKERCDFPVRMETPVVYFHSAEPLTVDVRVEFAKSAEGRLTEWYPDAAGSEDSNSLAWHGLKIDPAATGPFPTELGGDNYYAARAPAAAPVRIDVGKGATETEKFLFYRGVASFELPLKVTQDGARLRVANEGSETFGRAFLYSRHGEQAFLVDLGELRPGAVVMTDRVAQKPGQRVDLVPLENALVSDGLFRDEAAAMIATWRNSWFEEGVRVLFTLPRKSTDAILPLSITPPPQRIERVMVGRYEIVTTDVRDEILAFGDKLMREQASSDQIASFASRYGRLGFAVLARSGAELAEINPTVGERRSAAAWRFVDWQMKNHSRAIGQVAADQN